jgi:hypothetical protein
MREHWTILKEQNLLTDRLSILMEAKNGTIVEVFKWKSKEAMENAHANTRVQKKW